MMINDRIKTLQKEIEFETQRIKNCDHVFGTPFYNPYIEKEPYGFHVVGQGSDIWTEAEGYRDVTKQRWTRICTKCGFEQHTTKQKAVVIKEEPDF